MTSDGDRFSAIADEMGWAKPAPKPEPKRAPPEANWSGVLGFVGGDGAVMPSTLVQITSAEGDVRTASTPATWKPAVGEYDPSLNAVWDGARWIDVNVIMQRTGWTMRT